MADTTLNCCPYCGNKDIDIDVDIRIGCHLEDGQIMLNDGYADRISEAVSGTDYGEDAGGFCPECGEYFNISKVDDKGFYFEKLRDGQPRDIDKKYSHMVYVISVDDHQSGPEIAGVCRNGMEAEAFFRQLIEKRYWKPGTPWNGEYNDSIEQAVDECEYTSDMGDMVTINSFPV